MSEKMHPGSDSAESDSAESDSPESDSPESESIESGLRTLSDNDAGTRLSESIAPLQASEVLASNSVEATPPETNAATFIDRSASNSRRSLRREVRTECSVVAEDGFRLLAHNTVNISDEGLLVRAASDASVEIGEPVFIAMRIPDGSSWIDAGGTVVRIERDQIAVRIHTMAAVDRALYLGCIRRFPPMLPPSLRRPDYAEQVRNLAVA